MTVPAPSEPKQSSFGVTSIAGGVTGVAILLFVAQLLFLFGGDLLVAGGEHYVAGLRLLRLSMHCAIAVVAGAPIIMALAVEAIRRQETRGRLRIGMVVLAVILALVSGLVWRLLSRFGELRQLEGLVLWPMST